MEVPDRELMARLAAGDGDALEPLMQRHYQRVFRVALAYLRETDAALDAVQETFVKAFQNARSWDGASDAGPWLARIAVNHAIDRYRRGKRRAQAEAPMPESDHDERLSTRELSAERQVLGRELGERIGAALGTLPETQRAVFVLRHYEDMRLEEIAVALGMSLGTVKSSLHRAIRRLRVRLEGVRA